MRVVESLDVVEYGEPGFVPRPERVAVDELALQGRKETLAHRVIEAVSRRAHRGADTSLPAALPELKRRVLGEFNRLSQHLQNEVLR